MATTWQTPRFIELSMNAEIGSYQPDFEPGEDPAFVEDTREEEPAPAAGEAGRVT